MAVKIALPKGRLLKKTSALLHRAGWELDEYHSKISFYHPRSGKFPALIIKVLHEKDIPIQVAVGNYDLGIGSLDWVEELLVKYPSSDVVEIRELGYGHNALHVVADRPLDGIRQAESPLRIASEYPNLAEAYALHNRLKRFAIFPVWGAAVAYPPENAELALIAVNSPADINGAISLERVLNSQAVLIANRTSWREIDMGDIISSICASAGETDRPWQEDLTANQDMRLPFLPRDDDSVRLALPDGHQQQHMVGILNNAGIRLDDYPSESGNRRPAINLDGVRVKVVRPQDMPMQVANGNFDLAVTGRDWLTEHLCQFPSSPVEELLNLGFGRVRVVAVVSQSIAADDTTGLREHVKDWKEPLRVASEYVQLADRYAREHRLSPYRIIPTWGATEAYLPEDADILIENTETGRTIARHNLKIIDTLFESTACVIGYRGGKASAIKKQRMNDIINRLKTAVEERRA